MAAPVVSPVRGCGPDAGASGPSAGKLMSIHSHRHEGSAGASPQSCWRLNLFANRGCVSDLDVLAVRDNPGRALGPDCAYCVQPLFEHGSEPPRSAVFDAAQLIGQAEVAENRDRLRPFRFETAVAEPHVQV